MIYYAIDYGKLFVMDPLEGFKWTLCEFERKSRMFCYGKPADKDSAVAHAWLLEEELRK